MYIHIHFNSLFCRVIHHTKPKKIDLPHCLYPLSVLDRGNITFRRRNNCKEREKIQQRHYFKLLPNLELNFSEVPHGTKLDQISLNIFNSRSSHMIEWQSCQKYSQLTVRERYGAQVCYAMQHKCAHEHVLN